MDKKSVQKIDGKGVKLLVLCEANKSRNTDGFSFRENLKFISRVSSALSDVINDKRMVTWPDPFQFLVDKGGHRLTHKIFYAVGRGICPPKPLSKSWNWPAHS